MKEIINGIKRDVMVANGVRYYHDWERSEGGVHIIEPKTIDRYYDIKAQEPESGKYGIFFAFNKEQFEEGKQTLISKGYIKDESELRSADCQMFGTKSEIRRFLDFYKERNKMIANECDPQEVYFMEWNDHECMISGDDSEVVKLIAGYFGKQAAHNIKRIGYGKPINILVPLTERDEHLRQHEFTLDMLSRLKFDLGGFFNEDDCRYHRPSDLWGGCVKREIVEMRSLYEKLPDDIKDESPMSKDFIEQYAKELEAWAIEEFAKPEYDPTPTTYSTTCPEEILIEESLYYKDDEGHLQRPSKIWFSADHRRWHQDERMVHGRAMTSYLGKHGTTLTPVYVLGDRLVPYRRDDMCDVSCRYEKKGRHGRLYNFYNE